MAERCPQCGAEWVNGVTCEDHFYQMLAWEFENPEAGAVHHYTVLCYHLQHPDQYSPEGLRDAIQLLKTFIDGKSPAEVRRERRDVVDSGNRDWKFKGGGAVYDPDVRWTMTIAETIDGGLVGYAERVEAWARSVYESLEAAGYYTKS